jgi:hypothetical protein
MVAFLTASEWSKTKTETARVPNVLPAWWNDIQMAEYRSEWWDDSLERI